MGTYSDKDTCMILSGYAEQKTDSPKYDSVLIECASNDIIQDL